MKNIEVKKRDKNCVHNTAERKKREGRRKSFPKLIDENERKYSRYYDRIRVRYT